MRLPLMPLMTKFTHLALWPCVLMLSACPSKPTVNNNSKLALVIGNAAYENAPSLRNPTNDAADMCAALRGLSFKTLCHTNLRDRADFEARVKEYVDQLGPSSVGVVYFSGHGVQVNGANFLIPTRVQPKSAREDPMRMLYGVSDLFAKLRDTPSRFQLVILDACRTDLFAPALASGGTGRGPDATTQSALIRALGSAPKAASGLAQIQEAPRSTLVLYATASKEAAFDGEGPNGPLTKHVLKHIAVKGLGVRDFLGLVTEGVETETLRDYRKRQTPFVYGSVGGKVCLAGCSVIEPPPPAN